MISALSFQGAYAKMKRRKGYKNGEFLTGGLCFGRKKKEQADKAGVKTDRQEA
jgi:hypothetical protein